MPGFVPYAWKLEKISKSYYIEISIIYKKYLINL